MRVLVLFCLILNHTFAFANIQASSDKKSGPALVPGATLEVKGDRYDASLANKPMNRTFWVEGSYALVKLSCPEIFAASPIPTDSASITINVQYKVENPANESFTTKTETKVLYLKAGASIARDVDYLKLEDAQYAKVTIVENYIPASWPALELEASVVTNSFDFLKRDDINSIKSSLTHQDELTSDGNLKISWDQLPKAQSYELEWTYVSDHDGSTTNNSENRLDFDEIEIDRFLFRNNSSRVAVSGTSYEIPMIYEKGIIMYRLRAVGKNIYNGVVVTARTEWTAPDGIYGTVEEFNNGTNNNCYKFDGLEQNLNWQSSLVFSEEGKNKILVNYHDGSLRNRQVLTRINSDERSIVGETMYDYNGRVTIQTLPVPVENNSVNYSPNLNVIEGENVGKESYDNSSEICTPKTPSFNTNSGASGYYSNNNPFTLSETSNSGTNMINRNLLPDAEKYPYTQIKYTPDNTGRISARSGVGINYKLGSGREERFFYGTPQQPELSRLFGSQIGFSGYYKKNTVVDANGQSTVTYTDLKGNVVASGLAGDKPSSLHELRDDPGRTIKTDLLASGSIVNKLSSDRLSKVYNSKFNVTGPNTNYKFTYNGTLGSYEVNCQTGETEEPLNLKLDGVVKVNVQLVDQCGKVVFDQNRSTIKGYTGINQNLTIEETHQLQPGEYQISKTLSVDEEKLEEYFQEYLQREDICVLDREYFENEEIAKINDAGCGITCEECQEQKEQFLTSGKSFTTEEKELIEHLCDDICEDQSVGCRSALFAMIGDMSPGGQYGELRKNKFSNTGKVKAELDENNEPIVPEIDVELNHVGEEGEDAMFDAGNAEDNKIVVKRFPLSIYNPDNQLHVPAVVKAATGIDSAYWRNPLMVMSSSFTGANWKNQVLFSKVNLSTGLVIHTTDYMDRNGKVFYVKVYKVNGGDNPKYKPEVTDLSQVVPDEENGGYKVKVKYLARLEDFEKYWMDHWANYLVPYHPEFEYFLECTFENESHDFDYSLLNTVKVEEARTKGYLNASYRPVIINENSRTLSLDPYAKNNEANYHYMKTRTSSYATMEVQGVTEMRTMAQAVTIALGCPGGAISCANPNCTDGRIDTDAEWNAFKAMYISEKQKRMRDTAMKKAVVGLYYNGCIGNDEVLTSPESEYFREMVVCNGTRTEWVKDCNKEWWNNHWDFDWKCQWRQVELCNKETKFPYLNMAQLCDIIAISSKYYTDKVPRFYPSLPSDMAEAEPVKRCSTLVYTGNPDKPTETIKIACDEDLRESAEYINNRAYTFRYNSCGQCPLAYDMERLLMDLKAENKLVSVRSELINCQVDELRVTLGEALRRELQNVNNSDIRWSSAVSSDGKVLTGLLRGDKRNLNITLTIPSNVPETFSTLNKVCCLSMDNTASGSDVGKIFKLHSYYGDEIEFEISGVSSIALTPCDVAPRCFVSNEARAVALLVNTLTTFDSSIPHKKHDLNSGGLDVNLVHPDVRNFYAAAVRAMMMKDNDNIPGGYVENVNHFQPKWKSSVVSGILIGVFSYNLENDDRASIVINMNLPSGQYSKIRSISRLKPNTVSLADECRTQTCKITSFTADALVETSQGLKYEKLIIEVPQLTPVVCKPAQEIQN